MRHWEYHSFTWWLTWQPGACFCGSWSHYVPRVAGPGTLQPLLPETPSHSHSRNLGPGARPLLHMRQKTELKLGLVDLPDYHDVSIIPPSHMHLPRDAKKHAKRWSNKSVIRLICWGKVYECVCVCMFLVGGVGWGGCSEMITPSEHWGWGVGLEESSCMLLMGLCGHRHPRGLWSRQSVLLIDTHITFSVFKVSRSSWQTNTW